MAYAVAMDSDDKGGGADQQRIAELEAEVARLKAEAGAGVQGSAPSESPPRVDPATRTKMIVAAVVILVVALGLFSVVFVVLSKGFTSFAHKAAQVIVPTSGSGQGSAPSSPPTPAPPPEREPMPTAPGL